MTARVCPQCGDTLRRARAVHCSQACRRAAHAELLGEALHLLRFGLRLDEVAARLGRDADSLDRAVDRAVRRSDPGLNDLDLQVLRRLVRTDRARSRADAHAAQQDRDREWRWSS